MQLFSNYVTLLAVLSFASACSEATAPDDDGRFAPAAAATFRYVGRVDSSVAEARVLVGAASYVEFGLTGTDSVSVLLEATDFYVDSTWAVVEVDGRYVGRYAVHSGDTLRLPVTGTSGQADVDTHRVRIFHAAEPLLAQLIFYGTDGDRPVAFRERPTRRVTFFGDSMSAGAASDTSAGPCDRGLSNTNAYLAFPARLGRALEADYVVHAGSGRGLYTNWNGQDPPLPSLLPSLYMDTADARPYRLDDEDPDLALIALGTNDINSAPELRAEFDPAVFEATYREFVDALHAAYPRAALALVGTPMHGGAKNDTLNAIIARVAAYAKTAHPDLRAVAIPLEDRERHGCPAGPHPSTADHAAIAQEILGGLEGLLDG